MTKLDQPKEYTTSRNGGENNTWKGDAKTTCNVYGKINERTVTSKTRGFMSRDCYVPFLDYDPKRAKEY